MKRAARILLSLLTSLVVAGAVPSAEAAPLRVRVRGAAKLTARATRDQTQGVNELVLTGSLADDAGHPLALQTVSVRIVREANPQDRAVAEAIREARGCERLAHGAPSAGRTGPTSWGLRVTGPTDAPELLLTTDEDGRFCVRAHLEPDRYKANLSFSPADTQRGPPFGPDAPAADPRTLIDGIDREVVFDLSKRNLTLRFDPTPHVLQLDTPRASIEAVAIVDEDDNARVAPGLALVLANEKEELGRASTDASGRARFFVPGPRLGTPGRGELVVSFAGDGDTARASQSEEIERRLKVAVKVPAADRGELAPAVPEDGIALVAEVGSSLGPLGEGSIEARVGEVVVGAAPVERGTARLTLTFAAQGSEALVKLRYVPASPWYERLSEPTVRVPIRAPSLVSKAPILLAGLFVLAFFLFGRVSAKKAKPERLPPKAEAGAREGKPGVDVLRAAKHASEGWTGRVVDAHEGTPVAGARVWIERGTFEGRTVLGSVETDAAGIFAITASVALTGAEELAVEARFHARLTQALPPAGELSIALVQRRRALLAALVQWARRKGPPFDVRPEPTPGHVRRAAGGELTTARWAGAIERAAFGPGDTDAHAEQEVERLAPGRDGDPRPETSSAPSKAPVSDRR